MMKPIDEEGKSVKLDSLKELLNAFKKSSLDKLPKGKGVSLMSVSVSKPKSEESEEEYSDEEAPEMEMPEVSEEEESEEEDSLEPAVPAELMELVKEMLRRKSEKE